jgi:hypothetical protein
MALAFRARWRFGAAGAVGAEEKAWQGLWGKRHGEEGQPPDKEARCGPT